MHPASVKFVNPGGEERCTLSPRCSKLAEITEDGTYVRKLPQFHKPLKIPALAASRVLKDPKHFVFLKPTDDLEGSFPHHVPRALELPMDAQQS